MSMSTHIVGFVPPDDKWKRMKEVYDACEAAGVALPDAVDKFFDGETPDDEGMEVDMDKIAYEWGDRERQGFELRVDAIPVHVKVIRFYNSW